MKLLNAFLVRLALIGCVLLTASPLWAQTTINNTTLSAAMTATQTFVTVASVTCTGCTINSNTVIFVDSEAMCVNGSYVSGTTLPVTRGCLGSKAAAHGINFPTTNTLNVVFIGPANRFNGGALNSGAPPISDCDRASIQFLPWIDTSTGWLYTCDNYNWRALINFNLNGTSPSRPTTY